jgi:hypothetical protein
MRHLSALMVLLASVGGSAQVVPDCGSGCTGPTGEQWSNSQQACVAGPNMSCQDGCSCVYGFFMMPPPPGSKSGRLVPFGGGITTEGFRLDLIGPFGTHRVRVQDRIYRLNGRAPTRAMLKRYTRERPARRAQVTYDEQGRLHLRLWR